MILVEQIGAEWSIWSGFAGTLEVMNAIQHVRPAVFYRVGLEIPATYSNEQIRIQNLKMT